MAKNSKADKAAESAKSSAKRLRDKVKASEAGATRRVAMVGSSYGAGRYASAVERLSMGPVDGEAVLAVAGFAASMALGSGMAASIAEGIGDGMASVMALRAGQRASSEPAAAGYVGELPPGEDELPALEARLKELEARTTSGGETIASADDRAWADAAEAAGWAPTQDTDADDEAWASAAEAAGWAPPQEVVEAQGLEVSPEDAEYEDVLR